MTNRELIQQALDNVHEFQSRGEGNAKLLRNAEMELRGVLEMVGGLEADIDALGAHEDSAEDYSSKWY